MLGTFVEIAAEGEEAVEAGFGAIAAVHGLMSAHDPDSELSRLNREGVLDLNPWTASVLGRALYWAEASAGLFDPTVGALMQAVGLIPRHPGQPDADPGAGWRDVVLDQGRAQLARPCVLDLGGIAKGFAADRAAEAMQQAGAPRGLINAGGDLRAFGAQAWPVAVAEPGRRRPALRLRLRNRGVATSALLPGRAGARHLPRRSRDWASATVVAACAMDADALTKIVLADPPTLRACLAAAGARAVRLSSSGRWERVA